MLQLHNSPQRPTTYITTWLITTRVSLVFFARRRDERRLAGALPIPWSAVWPITSLISQARPPSMRDARDVPASYSIGKVPRRECHRAF